MGLAAAPATSRPAYLTDAQLEETWRVFLASATRYGAAQELGIDVEELDHRLERYVTRKGLAATPSELKAAHQAGSSPTVADTLPAPALAPQPLSRQDQVWQLIGDPDGPRLTQGEVARQLGLKQGSIQSALKGYMRAHGIPGPLPGLLTATEKAKARSAPKLEPEQGQSPRTKAKPGDPPAPAATFTALDRAIASGEVKLGPVTSVKTAPPAEDDDADDAKAPVLTDVSPAPAPSAIGRMAEALKPLDTIDKTAERLVETAQRFEALRTDFEFGWGQELSEQQVRLVLAGGLSLIGVGYPFDNADKVLQQLRRHGFYLVIRLDEVRP